MRDDPVVLTGAAILITAGVFLAYPWIMWTCIGLALAWYTTRTTIRAHRTRQAHNTALTQRADAEHALVLAGNPAGIYGQYPPSVR